MDSDTDMFLVFKIKRFFVWIFTESHYGRGQSYGNLLRKGTYSRRNHWTKIVYLNRLHYFIVKVLTQYFSDTEDGSPEESERERT